MKHEIIKTDNYLLVVDESEIKDVRPFVGKWHLEKGYILNKFPTYLTDLLDCKLVIAHLPLNGSPILEGVDLLPPLEEDDVERLAEEWVDQNSHKWSNNNNEVGDNYGSFKSGYNKAKEKYKYTEEDLLRLLCWADSDERNVQGQKFEDFIQSLSQPKIPIGFECEIYDTVFGDINTRKLLKWKPITTTTPEGHTQWVGTYIYG